MVTCCQEHNHARLWLGTARFQTNTVQSIPFPCLTHSLCYTEHKYVARLTVSAFLSKGMDFFQLHTGT